MKSVTVIFLQFLNTYIIHTLISPENMMVIYIDYFGRECSRMMVAFHQNAGKSKLTGVYRKYNTRKFGFAAKAEPAGFLLLGC